MLAASGAATWDFGPLSCDGCNLPRLHSSASLGHECNALIYERGGEGCSFLQVRDRHHHNLLQRSALLSLRLQHLARWLSDELRPHVIANSEFR
jgi:hypothetical protein